MILCLQLCGISLVRALSCVRMTMHNARSIQNCVVEIGVEVLDEPAQSPDLNPIEYLWDELEC